MHVVLFFSLFFWLFLTYQLASIQLAQASFFRKLADNQHLRLWELKPKRGTLYDRRMTPLTVNLNSDSFGACPKDMDQQQGDVASRLASVLDVTPQYLLQQFQNDSNFVWISRKTDPEIGEEIRSMKLPGVLPLEETFRCYPLGFVGREVVGSTNIDNKGIEGIELALDSLIHGVPGKCIVEMDARGRRHSDIRLPYQHPVDGHDVVLTLDVRCQSIVEEELQYTMEQTKAKKAVAIVMIPQTGEIVAMASAIGCDSSDSDRLFLQKNCAITDSYEPGSIFKMVAAAAALQEGEFRPNDKIFAENGAFSYAGSVLHDRKAFGWVTFQESIEYSINIAIAKVALKVGPTKYYEYVRKFGFGSRTGIELYGEVEGMLRNPASWSGRSLITMALGQEITVTPLQMVCAFGAVANGGNLMQPRLVKRVVSRSGEIVADGEPVMIRNVLGAEAARTMTSFLVGAVDHGTGKRAQIKGFTVAGKTGTAQKAEHGTYSKNKFVASFVGFLPAEDPQYVGIVMVDEPVGAYYGGEIAAPAFGRIMQRLVHLPESPIDAYRLAHVQKPKARVAPEPDLAESPAVQGNVVASEVMDRD